MSEDAYDKYNMFANVSKPGITLLNKRIRDRTHQIPQTDPNDPSSRMSKFKNPLTLGKMEGEHTPPKDSLWGAPDQLTGWAHKDDLKYASIPTFTGSGGYQETIEDGMNIRSEHSPQNYRVKWVQERENNIKEKMKSDMSANDLSRRKGDIPKSEWSRHRKELIDQHNQSMASIRWMKNNQYDVPWYIDAANLGGLLSGENNPLKNIWGDKEDG